ncbi:hypothetical protein MNBD_GAMMA12-2761 [hydrothermal vent metagenome]|uniref:Uncharacterized protein n=1 Tax=hydrothermal vent metagenome TaxID=652676 RepID=A0A3B0Y7G3_9ZZZZ
MIVIGQYSGANNFDVLKFTTSNSINVFAITSNVLEIFDMLGQRSHTAFIEDLVHNV